MDHAPKRRFRCTRVWLFLIRQSYAAYRPRKQGPQSQGAGKYLRGGIHYAQAIRRLRELLGPPTGAARQLEHITSGVEGSHRSFNNAYLAVPLTVSSSLQS